MLFVVQFYSDMDLENLWTCCWKSMEDFRF